MTRKEQAERKAAMIADYLEHGMTTRQIAAKYGRPWPSVKVSFSQWGISLGHEERIRRLRKYHERAALALTNHMI